MSVNIAIIATILAEMLWHMDSAAASKCNGYEYEFLLAGHLDKSSIDWRGSWQVNVWGKVHWEEVYSMGEEDWRCKFFIFIVKIDQSE